MEQILRVNINFGCDVLRTSLLHNAIRSICRSDNDDVCAYPWSDPRIRNIKIACSGQSQIGATSASKRQGVLALTGIAEHSDSLQYDTREFAFRKRRCRNKSESSDLALSCDTALPL